MGYYLEYGDEQEPFASISGLRELREWAARRAPRLHHSLEQGAIEEPAAVLEELRAAKVPEQAPVRETVRDLVATLAKAIKAGADELVISDGMTYD